MQTASKKVVNGWAMYDWANSVYNLVITSTIFPAYYEAITGDGNENTLIDKIKIGPYEFSNTALYNYILAIAFVIVAILSPILSSIADYRGNKKQFLRFFCTMGSLACASLYFFDSNHIIGGLISVIIACVGFWGSLVFYNSYLPDIAFPEQQDKISAKGFSIGYIGSVLLLIINLAMVMKPEFFGITGTSGEASMKAMRYSFVMVGIWWIGFSQYTYYYLPNGNKGHKVTKAVVFNGFHELKKVWYLLEHNVQLKRFLGSFFVYGMAVQTVMIIAVYFGEQEISWASDSEKTTGLIISILVIQLVAILGANLTSKASEKFGNITTLIFLNCIWAVLCLVAFFVTLPIEFYLTAGFVGLVMGGIQALSRSTYSKMLPETDDTASFFSFYDVSEKIGIVIGMCLYGIIDQVTGSPRYSIVFLGLFFVTGIVLLSRVPKKIMIK